MAPVTSMETRSLDEATGIIDITGDLTSAREQSLMEAYARAGGERLRSIVIVERADYLDFQEVVA